jgi:hypothetical protein
VSEKGCLLAGMLAAPYTISAWVEKTQAATNVP